MLNHALFRTPKMPVTICGDNKDTPCDIYLQIEPEPIYPIEDYLLKSCSKYKYIVTYSKKVLEKCPNARLGVYGTSWISQSDWENLPPKQWLITSITGLNNRTPAHAFRRKVYDEQDKIPSSIPIKFFRSCNGADQLKDFGHNPVLTTSPTDPSCSDAHGNKPAKIQALGASQYHIIIENSRQENYFTEKLCDALITKNIPIYYGCPNIGDFFDTTGWIIIEKEDTDDLYRRIGELTKDSYGKHIKTVMDNFNTVMKYKSEEENINRALDQMPEVFSR